MVERQPANVEYTVRQRDGAWVWEITEQARVLASGCSPTEADARAQALSRQRNMRDFTIRVAGETILFRFGADFAEGE